MQFSLLINIYGAKIYKKIGKANFEGAKLKNVCYFLSHNEKFMPKWHEEVDFSTFWHTLC